MFFPLIIVVIIIVAEAANFMSNKLTKELIKEGRLPWQCH